MKKIETPFRKDLIMAEEFDKKTIRALVKVSVKQNKDNPEKMAGLTIALNGRLWDLYEKNADLANYYEGLWDGVQDFCFEHFKGKDLKEYLKLID